QVQDLFAGGSVGGRDLRAPIARRHGGAGRCRAGAGGEHAAAGVRGAARARPGALRHLLRAVPWAGRRRRRRHRRAWVPGAAVLSSRSAARGAGAAFLRRDQQGLRRDVFLRRPHRRARPLGHRRLYPRVAAVAPRDRRPGARSQGRAAMSNGAPFRLTGLLVAAAAAAAGLVALAVVQPKSAAAGWLVGFLFWSQLPIGSLVLLLIHALTGGRWGESLRPALAPTAA